MRIEDQKTRTGAEEENSVQLENTRMTFGFDLHFIFNSESKKVKMKTRSTTNKHELETGTLYGDNSER